MTVIWYGDKLIKDVDTKCLQGVKEACSLVEDDAKRMVAVKTGKLKASITHEVEKKGEEVVSKIGSNVEYALAQEYGTSKMGAHPYLRPALEKNKSKIEQQFKGK